MSINDINIFRIVVSLVLVIFQFVFISVTVVCLKRELLTSRKNSAFLACVYLVGTLFFVMLLSPVFDIGSFRISKCNENIFKSLSIDSINLEMFDLVPIDNIKDRRLLVSEDENTIVYCTIQPTGTHIQILKTNENFFIKEQEKVCLNKYKNNFGTIYVNPIYLERTYLFFVECYRGSIVIPISENEELLLEYECNSNKETCDDFIFNLLKDTTQGTVSVKT